MPSGTSYAPSLAIAALKQSPASVGFSQAITVSIAAFAADVAEDAPLASITAFPLCCTVGINSDSIQFISFITSLPSFPEISAFSESGYIVGL